MGGLDGWIVERSKRGPNPFIHPRIAGPLSFAKVVTATERFGNMHHRDPVQLILVPQSLTYALHACTA